jgi:hypothetical protein
MLRAKKISGRMSPAPKLLSFVVVLNLRWYLPEMRVA